MRFNNSKLTPEEFVHFWMQSDTIEEVMEKCNLSYDCVTSRAYRYRKAGARLPTLYPKRFKGKVKYSVNAKACNDYINGDKTALEKTISDGVSERNDYYCKLYQDSKNYSEFLAKLPEKKTLRWAYAWRQEMKSKGVLLKKMRKENHNNPRFWEFWK